MNENNQPQSQQTPESAPNENYQYEKFTESQKYWYEMYAQGKPSSESSHSPNEQPGDTGNLNEEDKIFIDGDFNNSYSLMTSSNPAHREKGRQIRITELLEQIKYERAKHAELVAENARLKAECSSHEKERYEIYSFDSSQAMEIKALQKELEQLRSERDKLKSDCDAWKGMIVPILDFAQQHGKQLGIRPGESIPEKVLEILKSALSWGSKQ